MYINSEFDSTFAQINGNNSELSTTKTGQQDNVVNLAVNCYVMPSLNLIASVYFDYGQNVLSTGDDGERYSGLLVADYYFSKDFDAYIGRGTRNSLTHLRGMPQGRPTAATSSRTLVAFSQQSWARGSASNLFL